MVDLVGGTRVVGEVRGPHSGLFSICLTCLLNPALGNNPSCVYCHSLFHDWLLLRSPLAPNQDICTFCVHDSQFLNFQTLFCIPMRNRVIYTPCINQDVRTVKIPNRNKCQQGYGEWVRLIHCWWKFSQCSHCGKQYTGFLGNSKHTCPMIQQPLHWVEDNASKRYLHHCAYSSTIHNTQNLGPIKMSIIT